MTYECCVNVVVKTMGFCWVFFYCFVMFCFILFLIGGGGVYFGFNVDYESMSNTELIFDNVR